MQIKYRQLLNDIDDRIGISIVVNKDDGKLIMRHAIMIKSENDIEDAKIKLKKHVMKYINKKKEKPNLRFWTRYYYEKIFKRTEC